MSHESFVPEEAAVFKLAEEVESGKLHERAFRALVAGSLKPIAPGDAVNWSHIEAMDEGGDDYFAAVWGQKAFDLDDRANHPARHYLDEVCRELVPCVRGGGRTRILFFSREAGYYYLLRERGEQAAWDEFAGWCGRSYDPFIERLWRQVRSMAGPRRPTGKSGLQREVAARLGADSVAECRGERLSSRSVLLLGTIHHLVASLGRHWRMRA